MERVPPEPPHASLHGRVCKGLPHVPSVPQQDVLVIAETHRPDSVLLKVPRWQGTSPRDTHPTQPSRTKPCFLHPGLRAGPIKHRSRQLTKAVEGARRTRVTAWGLTFLWPRGPPSGGCSGCCTRPWSVCEQRGDSASTRKGTSQREVMRGAGGLSHAHTGPSRLTSCC